MNPAQRRRSRFLTRRTQTESLGSSPADQPFMAESQVIGKEALSLNLESEI